MADYEAIAAHGMITPLAQDLNEQTDAGTAPMFLSLLQGKETSRHDAAAHPNDDVKVVPCRTNGRHDR